MKVGVVGASGYAGGELLRLLLNHPEFHVTEICAGSNSGELITSIHPQLLSYSGQVFQSTEIDRLNACDLIFLALPHGESKKLIPQIDQNIKIIDLGADFRLENAPDWKKYYEGDHAGFLPYGLPELVSNGIYREKRVSNPGCYATAISLGAAPLSKLSQVDFSDLVVVAASGTTGAGRNLKSTLLASEVVNNLVSYKFGGIHQHTPEVEQLLEKFSGRKVNLSFTPILAPMPRGILATITSKYSGDLSEYEVRGAYTELYKGREFVRLLPPGQLPNTAAVNGTNYALIQVAVDAHASRVVVSVALDNLGKGAAGQAIQNANLMCGFDETLGLMNYGVK